MAVPAIHPGEHLTEELKDLNMSAAALARRAQGAHEPHRRDSQRPAAVAGDTALRLAVLLGTSAEFWLNLQKLYELRPAQKRAGKMIKALPTLTKRTRPRLSVAGARNGPSHPGLRGCRCRPIEFGLCPHRVDEKGLRPL